MPKFYLGICFFLIAFVVGGWWVLGFFEIEMDNNRQIVLFFWSASNLLRSTFFRLVVVFFFYGEFDPGSGRTLAACLTHASRTMNSSLLGGLVANG
jgi:hypothetical protein